MKINLKKTILTVAISLIAAVSISAQEVRINLGEMSLNTEYPLESFKNYIGTFKAPKSGTVTCNSTTTDILYPYLEEKEDMYSEGNELAVTYNSMFGQKSYDFKVEEGKTYVMYASFIMNNGTVMTMTMNDGQSFKLISKTPADGVFNVSNGGQMAFDFDKAVSVAEATINCNGKSARLNPSTNVGSVFFETKSIVWDWLTNGTAKEGDKFTIKMTGLCLVADNTVLYNGTGVFEEEFTFGPMPIYIVSEENTSGDFLSYYRKDDSKGVVRLTFSGPVKEGATAILKYGNIDQDADGEYYVENLPTTIEGNTLCINLNEKRRRASDMVKSGTVYPNIVLGVTGVFDTNGNYAYATGSGSLGSYWYSYNFKEIGSNVVAEFTPANGADLKNTKNIEIWITDEDKLTYSGIEFTYEVDGVSKSVVVTDFKKENDPEEENAKILTVPVPAEVATAKNVVLTFKDLQSSDGTDFSNVLRSRYNSFVISRTTPVANSTIETLAAGTNIAIYTNLDATAARLYVSLNDMNAEPGHPIVLFEGNATKATKGFTVNVVNDVNLIKGHEYHLDVVAFDAQDNKLGEDYVAYTGAYFVVDPAEGDEEEITFASITPANGTSHAAIPDFFMTFTGGSQVGYGVWQLNDLNATNPDETNIYTGQLKKQEDGSWKAHSYFALPLYEGHTYEFVVNVYDSEETYNYAGAPLKTLSIQINGSEKAYEYAAANLVKTYPENNSTLLSLDQSNITLTFDAAVETLEAELNGGLLGGQKLSASSNEGKTEWTVALPANALANATGSFNIVITAKDSEGRVVKGNEGENEYSVINLTYLCYLGAPEFTITPANGSTVASISTVVATYEGGIYISGSCSDSIRIYCGEDVVAEISYENIAHGNVVGEEYTTASFTLPTPITAQGTYTIVYPTTFFMLGSQYNSCCSKEQKVVINVSGNADAISEVNAEAQSSVVYSLSGQRLATPVKGINIINGKKVLR